MLSSETYAHWQGPAPARLKRDVGLLLRAMGQLDENKSVPDELLRDTRWKTPAQALLGQLIEQRQHGFWNKFPELIIVPDDVVWHVPFEALQIPAADGTEPLGTKVRVRYLPVASLIVPDQRGPKPLAKTAVVLGRLYPSDDPQVAADAFAVLQGVLPGATAIGTSPVPTGLLRITWDQLIVLDDITDLDRGPLAWCPTQIDKGKPGGTLSRWLELPWGAPEQIVLPGFKTAAASGLKRSDNADMFMASCGLMACGVRHDSDQPLADRRPNRVGPRARIPAGAASRRRGRCLATQRAAGTHHPDRLAREPRVNSSAQAEPMTAEHPFFWSGYVVIDRAGKPEPEPAQ